jgi:uncharacterized UPF0160 family protein
MMKFKTNSEISDIHIGLVSRTLPKSEWTHAAHFAAAISMLADPREDPFTSLPDIIRKYNLATGVENTETEGYHHTITLASLLAAEHILTNAPNDMDLFEVTNRLIESEYGTSDWILGYWTRTVLFAPKARRIWVPPNIKPLPFPMREF